MIRSKDSEIILWKTRMSEQAEDQERFPWAGPTLFIIVLFLTAAFFWWFVRA